MLPLPLTYHGGSSLDLNRCDISGTIPTTMALLANSLAFLDLSQNSLTGTVPEALLASPTMQ